MNMPLVLLNRRRRGFTAFSPSTLFALAEPGVWFDPSDLTTLFTDPAGTTPVTAPGNTVGLMLDKSKGLALGAELVSNPGPFANTTGWLTTSATPLSVSSGILTGSTSAATDGIIYGSWLGTLGPSAQNKYFQITTTITALTGRVRLQVYGSNVVGPWITSPGTYTVRLYQTVANGSVGLNTDQATTVSISAFGVRELAGNHATQATLAARPTYSIEPVGGRRNLLLQTEAFGSSDWTKSGVTASAHNVADPDGGFTASTITATTPLGYFFPNTVTNPTSGSTAPSLWIRRRTGSGDVRLRTSAAGVDTPITITSSWQRISVVCAAVAGALNCWVLSIATSGDAIDIWHPQLETGSTATNYQRVTTQYDVTEAGVASVSYLFFDGSDDGMVTSTITPGVDKVQVFAGVRKNTDGLAIVAELGPVVNSTVGTFFLGTYSGQAFGSTGTAGYRDALFSPVANPNTSVLTGFGDISGDRATLRANGVQIAQNTGDQGTGNYNSHVLNIGRRGNAAVAVLSGHLYSLITRFGPTLDAPTITSTEIWVGDKTGIDVAKNISTTIYTRSGDTILDRANSTIERRAV